MKKFMFLSSGFENPTPEIMGAWGKWFESIADRITDQGGFWSGGREITKKGTRALSLDKDALTGFIIFHATDLDEAHTLAQNCPVVKNNQVYEIMTK